MDHIAVFLHGEISVLKILTACNAPQRTKIREEGYSEHSLSNNNISPLFNLNLFETIRITSIATV